MQDTPDSGHRQETWEQARERLGKLPEPDRTQQLEILENLRCHGEKYRKNPMAAPVKHPHIIYRSDPLPEAMRERLRALEYAPHVTELLMQGLPITYNRAGKQIVEYPNGRRIWVNYDKIYDEQGVFQTYYYYVLGDLDPAER